MRWFWIDCFTELVSGQRATAIKNVSLSEEHIHDHFPYYPVMPTSLIIEGMAQTGGLLVSEYNDFAERVVLAKLSKCIFHRPAVPGDTLTYRAEIQQIGKEGAMVTTTSHVGEHLQAEAEIFFAHLDDRSAGKLLFEPEAFLAWLRMMCIFDVGRKADGSPIVIPDHLLSKNVD
jgi:3-hydroxyacyl-[acyl-carrier-protein] dehydratase